MGRGYFISVINNTILEIFGTMRLAELGLIFIQIVKDMKDLSFRGKNMVMEVIIILQEIFTKDNGLKI